MILMKMQFIGYLLVNILGYSKDKAITHNSTYSIRFNHEVSNKLKLMAAYFSSTLDLQDKRASLGSYIVENGESVL